MQTRLHSLQQRMRNHIPAHLLSPSMSLRPRPRRIMMLRGRLTTQPKRIRHRHKRIPTRMIRVRRRVIQSTINDPPSRPSSPQVSRTMFIPQDISQVRPQGPRIPLRVLISRKNRRAAQNTISIRQSIPTLLLLRIVRNYNSILSQLMKTIRHQPRSHRRPSHILISRLSHFLDNRIRPTLNR